MFVYSFREFGNYFDKIIKKYQSFDHCLKNAFMRTIDYNESITQCSLLFKKVKKLNKIYKKIFDGGLY